MHIAFLTTCLEPGKDGVGDYTRDLAAACVRLGHSCTLLAVNDRYVDEIRKESQTARDMEIEALRLPALASWTGRAWAAKQWLARRPPDWLSLQFVPYGFHPKGLVGGLDERLAPLAATARHVHVMLHELWIGAERGASLKHRMVGFLQRRGVTSLVRRLSPGVIHTTNDAYRSLSEAVGIRAKLLPLCGSIPIATHTDPQWLETEFLKLGVPAAHVKPREECWWFGMFGSLHPEWAPEPVFSHIAEAASRAHRRVVVSAIGRQGAGTPLWRSLQERYGSRFAFAALGERSPREVSMFLQGLDYGIATTPWQLIGKSATVAAMVDHGLPVIVSRDDVRLRLSQEPRSSAEPLLYRMDAQLPRWLLGQSSRAPARDGLARLADTFLSDLSAATT
jgi:hypothetical protein